MQVAMCHANENQRECHSALPAIFCLLIDAPRPFRVLRRRGRPESTSYRVRNAAEAEQMLLTLNCCLR